MRTRFDQLAKDLSIATLGSGAREGMPVASEAQTMDLWFEPDPQRLPELATLGLLGRMGMSPMGLEAFHNTPGVEDVRECVRKSLTLHHQRAGGRERGAEVALARMWVISAGRARGALTDFGMVPAEGWPQGVYCSNAGIGLWLVVVSELPRTRETLALRLMGRDEVLLEASRELAALPVDAWERQRLLPVLVRWRFEIPADPAARDAEEEVFMATAQQLFETFEQQAIEKGVKQGLEEGVKQGLEKGVKQGVAQNILRLFACRLDRPLTKAERATVGERLRRLGEDRLDKVVLNLSAAELAAWLADPDAR